MKPIRRRRVNRIRQRHTRQQKDEWLISSWGDWCSRNEQKTTQQPSLTPIHKFEGISFGYDGLKLKTVAEDQSAIVIPSREKFVKRWNIGSIVRMSFFGEWLFFKIS